MFKFWLRKSEIVTNTSYLSIIIIKINEVIVFLFVGFYRIFLVHMTLNFMFLKSFLVHTTLKILFFKTFYVHMTPKILF